MVRLTISDVSHLLKISSDNVMTAEEMQKRTDNILVQMDEKGISNKKLRKEVIKVMEESVAKMQEYEEKLEIVGKRLVKAEFATIAIAHNIRKMVSNGYNVRSEAVVG